MFVLAPAARGKATELQRRNPNDIKTMNPYSIGRYGRSEKKFKFEWGAPYDG
jgi:hypothetical protein